MIIGLSGYAGSGKDTVAIIIQWIMSKERNTVLGEILRNPGKYSKELTKQSGWEVKKYAAKLKQVAGIILSWQPENFERQEVKEMNLGKEWNEMSVRAFLQRIGTDGLRDGLHKDVWVNALWSDYYGGNWVVTDVRFVNEAQRIKDKGGVIVRVSRENNEPINQHISETALDNWPFDHVIHNNESVEALVLSVSQLLRQLNLYEDN